MSTTSPRRKSRLYEELSAEKLLVKQRDEQFAAANQKVKSAMAKVVHAFQLINEYNAILFGWYFKVFVLLRRYLVKHGPKIDLKDLDFEAINNEIEGDEATQAAQAAQAVASAGEDPLVPEKGGTEAPEA